MAHTRGPDRLLAGLLRVVGKAKKAAKGGAIMAADHTQWSDEAVRLLRANLKENNRREYYDTGNGDPAHPRANRRHFLTALSTSNHLGCADSALAILGMMKEAGHMPTLEAYSFALGAASRRGNVEVVGQLWREMHERGLRPCPACYACVMRAIERAQCGADDVEEEASSAAAAAAAESGCERPWRSAKRARMLRVFQAMLGGGGKPDDRHYSALLMVSRDEAAAEDLYRYAVERGFVPRTLAQFYAERCAAGLASAQRCAGRCVALAERSGQQLLTRELLEVLRMLVSAGAFEEAVRFFDRHCGGGGGGGGGGGSLAVDHACDASRAAASFLPALLRALAGVADRASDTGLGGEEVSAVLERGWREFDAVRTVQGTALRGHPEVYLALAELCVAAGGVQGVREGRGAADVFAVAAMDDVVWTRRMAEAAEAVGVRSLHGAGGTQNMVTGRAYEKPTRPSVFGMGKC